MTKKYLINYGGSKQKIEVSKNQKRIIEEGQIINFFIDAYQGNDNNVYLINLDSNRIYDYNDKKIDVSEYKFAIIPGDGIFIQRDRTIKISGFRHKRCNGCTTFIQKKKKYKKVNNNNVIEFPYYPEDINKFKICKDTSKNNYQLIPIRLVGKIKKIDFKEKYVDVSISDYYKLTDYC